MLTANIHQEEQTKTTKNNHRKLEVIGCGLFLIWIGISILADLGWGIGLIRIGLLIIGLQTADAFLTSAERRRSTKELF